MVPMRHVGGGGMIEVNGMGMESVFPVPGILRRLAAARIPTDSVIIQMNAFPEIFGQIAFVAIQF